MTQEETLNTLLEFFKALADENRLKIIGLLAQNPTSVEALADALGLSVSTTSHHLSRLSKSGLVSARADGHYFIYSLQTEKLKDMSRHLLQEENLPALSVDTGEDAFERKVLSNFVDKDGRIVSFPVQEKKFAVLLRYALRSFEPGKRYTEKEVNALLSHYNEDTAALRRGMIEYRLLQRESNGSAYWLTES
jgi:predicted transcriptional regulator